jgi:hypothetical protein
MKNIYTFFWVSLAVKILLFVAMNFFFWEIKSFSSEQILWHAIAILLFAITSFLKFRGARTFGSYLKVMEYEFSFMFISALSLKDVGFGVIAFFTIAEWHLYLKEFCIIKPSSKFDGVIETEK